MHFHVVLAISSEKDQELYVAVAPHPDCHKRMNFRIIESRCFRPAMMAGPSIYYQNSGAHDIMTSNLIKQLAACGNHSPAFFFLVLRVCNFIIELSSETNKKVDSPHKLDIKSWRSFNSPQSSWVLAGFSVLLIYLRPHLTSNWQFSRLQNNKIY